jgi:uncharacterized protein (DUF362 family)
MLGLPLRFGPESAARVLCAFGVCALQACGDGEASRSPSFASAAAGSSQGGQSGSGGDVTVAIAKSDKANASELTEADVLQLVRHAVTLARGLDFIQNGHTVVLKPNLVNTTSTRGALPSTVNGVTTDWRVVKAVATLVRERNPSGKVLVMEGSTESTPMVFAHFGYVPDNFGSLVDEFVALEGDSCSNRSTFGLVQKKSFRGGTYWVNERYFEADAVISIAVLKTHNTAGITGSVKNLGIGATPASQYSASGCGRTQSAPYIEHTRVGLGQFISEFYSVRRADFAVIDGLQGIQNGPNPLWTQGGDYDTDKMNMRLIMAGRDPVAVDTIQSQVMGCDPSQIDHLVLLDAAGIGVAQAARIRVVGSPVSAVKREFLGPEWACGVP